MTCFLFRINTNDDISRSSFLVKISQSNVFTCFKLCGKGLSIVYRWCLFNRSCCIFWWNRLNSRSLFFHSIFSFLFCYYVHVLCLSSCLVCFLELSRSKEAVEERVWWSVSVEINIIVPWTYKHRQRGCEVVLNSGGRRHRLT